MKFLGFITFILLLSYSSYPTKTKRLESELKILKRNIKGGNIMKGKQYRRKGVVNEMKKSSSILTIKLLVLIVILNSIMMNTSVYAV